MGCVVAATRKKKLNCTNNMVKSSYDVHKYPQLASIPLQGLISKQFTESGSNSRSTSQFRPLHWHHFTSCEFTWSAKKHSVKADHSTLASGDSEHAKLLIVAIYISWDNKVNFSLCVNMAGFAEPFIIMLTLFVLRSLKQLMHNVYFSVQCTKSRDDY